MTAKTERVACDGESSGEIRVGHGRIVAWGDIGTAVTRTGSRSLRTQTVPVRRYCDGLVTGRKGSLENRVIHAFLD